MAFKVVYTAGKRIILGVPGAGCRSCNDRPLMPDTLILCPTKCSSPYVFPISGY